MSTARSGDVLNTDIEALIEYVRQYDPGFIARIKGAGEGELAYLEQLAGRSLPDTYHQFLQRMGRDTGGLELLGDCSTNIGDVIDYYEGARLNPRIVIPDGCILITDCVFDGAEFCLDMRHEPEPQVVGRVGPNQTAYYASSLPALLHSVAFRAYRQGTLSSREYVSSYDDVGRRYCLPEAEQRAERDFTRQWFSDRHDFCGEGEAAALYLRQSPSGSGLYLSVAARTEQEAEKIADPFARQFNLRPHVTPG